MLKNKKLIAVKSKENKSRSLNVDWYISKRCNYDCIYCPDSVHDSFSGDLTYEELVSTADKLFFNYGKKLNFSLTGGEPLLNSNFNKICKYLKHDLNVNLICVTSNGSFPLNYYKKLFLNIDSLIISIHFEFVGKKINEYIKKLSEIGKYCDKLNRDNKSKMGHETENKPKTLIIRFMMLPGYFNEIKKMANELEKNGVKKIDYRGIRPPYPGKINRGKIENLKNKYNKDKKTYRYVEKFNNFLLLKGRSIANLDKGRERYIYNKNELKFIDDTLASNKRKDCSVYYKENERIIKKEVNYQDLIYNGLNLYRNWLCWAGVSAIKIDHNGDIYSGSCLSIEKIGNIKELNKTIFLPGTPVICCKERCYDIIDLRQPKVIDKKYFKLVKNRIAKKNN